MSVKLVSCDQQEFLVPRDILVHQSSLIRGLFADEKDVPDTVPVVPIPEVRGEILAEVITFLERHKEDEPFESKPGAYLKPSHLTPWDVRYLGYVFFDKLEKKDGKDDDKNDDNDDDDDDTDQDGTNDSDSTGKDKSDTDASKVNKDNGNGENDEDADTPIQFDADRIMELCAAAIYLQTDRLYHYCVMTYAHYLNGKTPEELGEIFGCEPYPEEKRKDIREEYGWLMI